MQKDLINNEVLLLEETQSEWTNHHTIDPAAGVTTTTQIKQIQIQNLAQPKPINKKDDVTDFQRQELARQKRNQEYLFHIGNHARTVSEMIRFRNEYQQELTTRASGLQIPKQQQIQKKNCVPINEFSSALLIQNYENNNFNTQLDPKKRSATCSTARSSNQYAQNNMGQIIMAGSLANNIHPEIQNSLKSSNYDRDNSILRNIGYQISPIRQIPDKVKFETKNSIQSSNSGKTNFTFQDRILLNKNELSSIQRNIFDQSQEQNKYSQTQRLSASSYLGNNQLQSKMNETLLLNSPQQQNPFFNKIDQQQSSFYLSLKQQQTPSTAKQSMYNNQTQSEIVVSNQPNMFSLSLASDIYQQKPKNVFNSTIDGSIIKPEIQNSLQSSKLQNSMRYSTPIIQNNPIFLNNNNSSSIYQISGKDNNQIGQISSYVTNNQLPYSNLVQNNKYESYSLPHLYENSHFSQIKNPTETQSKIYNYTPILQNQIEYKSTELQLNNKQIENNNLIKSLPDFNYQYSSNSNKSSKVFPIINKPNYLGLVNNPILSSERHFTLQLNNVQKDSKILNESQIQRKSLNDDTSKNNKDLIIQLIEFKKQEYLNHMNDDNALSVTSRTPQTNKSEVVQRYKATEMFSQLESYRNNQFNQDKTNYQDIVVYPHQQDTIKGVFLGQYQNQALLIQPINTINNISSSILPGSSRINNFIRSSQDQQQINENRQSLLQSGSLVQQLSHINQKNEISSSIPKFNNLSGQFENSQKIDNQILTSFQQQQIQTKDIKISTPTNLNVYQDQKTSSTQRTEVETIINFYKTIPDEQNIRQSNVSHSLPPSLRVGDLHTDKVQTNPNYSFTIMNPQLPSNLYQLPQNNVNILRKISQQFEKKNESEHSNFPTQQSAQNLQETQIQTLNGLTVSFSNNSNIVNSAIEPTDKKFDRKQDTISFNNSILSHTQDQLAQTSTSASTHNTTNVTNPFQSTQQSLVKLNAKDTEQNNQQVNKLTNSMLNKVNTPSGSPKQDLNSVKSSQQKDYMKKCEDDQDIIEFDIQQRQNDNKNYMSEKKNMNGEQANIYNIYQSPLQKKDIQQIDYNQSNDKLNGKQNWSEGQMNTEHQESDNNLQTQDSLRTSQKNPNHVRFDNTNQFFNISSNQNNLDFHQCQAVQIDPKNGQNGFTQTDQGSIQNASVQTQNQGSGQQRSLVFDECTKVFSPRMKLIEPELRENQYMMLNTSQQSDSPQKDEQQNNKDGIHFENNIEQKQLQKRSSNGIQDTVLFNTSLYNSHKGSEGEEAIQKQQQSIYNKIFEADELPAVEQTNQANFFKAYKQIENENNDNNQIPMNGRTYSSQYTDKEKKRVQNQVDSLINKISPKNQKNNQKNTNKPLPNSNKSLKNSQISARNTKNQPINQKHASSQQLINKQPSQSKQNEYYDDKKHINFNNKVETRIITDNKQGQSNKQEGQGANKAQYPNQLNKSKPKKIVQSLSELKQANTERRKSNNKFNGEMDFIQRNKQNVPYMMKNKVEDEYMLFKKAVEYNLTNIVQEQKTQSIKSLVLEDSLSEKDQLEEIFQKSLINRSQKNLVSCDSMTMMNRSKYNTYQP